MAVRIIVSHQGAHRLERHAPGAGPGCHREL